MNKKREHENIMMPCKGKPRVGTYGYLCDAHEYIAFLRDRSNTKASADSYDAKSEDDTVFSMFDYEDGE